MGNIVTLSVGMPTTQIWNNKEMVTAIKKEEVESCFLAEDGFYNDDVANKKYHGGKERAVCYYPFEHYDYWQDILQQPIHKAAFGENICGLNFSEKETYIGDIFAIGETVVQVTQGRIPCSTISMYNDSPSFLQKIVQTCYTGYFMKVLQEGTIHAEDEMKLIEREQSEISVWLATNTLFHDKKNKETINKILKLGALAFDWRTRFEKLAAK